MADRSDRRPEEEGATLGAPQAAETVRSSQSAAASPPEPSASAISEAERPYLSRRAEPRVKTVSLRVDVRCDDTFLYAYVSNVSSMGIFLQTPTPRPPGTPVELIFDADTDAFVVPGTVAWVNPYREGGENTNPGMGIRFLEMGPDKRERMVRLVRRIAYLPDEGDDRAGRA